MTTQKQFISCYRLAKQCHAHYLPDHLPFLGSPGDEIGKTVLTQSSQRKEYTLLHKRGVRVASSNPNLLSVLQTC